MTNTSIGPELAASVRYQPMAGEWSLTYGRTQATVIGLANVAETQSLSIAVTRPLWASIHMRLAPTLFRSDVDRSRADAWVLAIDLTRSITRGLALDLAVDASMQRGGLNLPLANPTIARQVVLLRVVAGSPTLLR